MLTDVDLLIHKFNLKNIFIDFRESGRDGERQRDRSTDLSPPVRAPTRGRIRNLGLFPDWETNPQHLVHGTTLQPTGMPSQGLTLI